MIQVENLCRRYGPHTALDGISFEAAPGEVVGLLGPNGAGKTTTMRILTGYMPPTSGRAVVAGFDVQTQSMQARAAVGYLPERVPLYPDMTVAGYVTFWAQMRGIRKARTAAQQALEQVDLWDRRRSLVRSLSKGMRQRLGLAQALVHAPSVVILDEPTIGIDPQQVIDVRQAVRGLGVKHTVLFSTHILTEAEQVCDRVIILNQGRIVAHGTPSELRATLYAGDRLYVQVSKLNPEAALKALKSATGVARVEPSDGGYLVYGQPNIAPGRTSQVRSRRPAG
ncbi:MAG: putative ABC transporter ATP-binding protein [Chloroflexi bacterium OLB13]|nr:MAG: putative ABC transporter ATP-binding protein [Chloroflexi bacterium OLB13]